MKHSTSDTPSPILLRVPESADTLLYKGAERLAAKALAIGGRRIDMAHGMSERDDGEEGRALQIVLAPHTDLPGGLAQRVGLSSDSPDAYAVRTIREEEQTVAVLTGNSPRACLFAAYALAEEWETCGRVELSDLDLSFAPKVPHRWLLFQYGVSGGWNASMRFNRTQASIAETPKYGLNGVYLFNAPVWPWYTLEVEGDTVRPIETEAAELKQILGGFKEYGLEIAYACPLNFPTEYSAEDINAFLCGKKELPGYLDSFQAYHRKLINAFLEAYPEVDALVASTVEGAMGWGFRKSAGVHSAATVAKTLFLDSNGQDLDICAEVFRAYLDVFDEVLRKHGKQGLFQTHSCGPTDKGMRKMREVLEAYPDIVQVEDDRWNNSGWVNLPIYGFLPDDLKQTFLARREKGMKVICEGEFLGGGALPTCIPEPLEDASDYTVDHGMGYHWTRIDLHERTEYGTFFGINEINVLGAMAPMWEPKRPLDDLWERWIARRFGRDIVDELKPVLQASWEILRKGAMVAGLPLLHGSRLVPDDWVAEDRHKTKNYQNWVVLPRFRRPGTPLLTPDTEVWGGNYAAWQLDAKSVPVADVRSDQREALELTEQCIDSLRALETKLSAEDYLYLLRIYTTTKRVIEALMAAVEGAYAANIMRDNYDGVDNPDQLFRDALQAIEKTAAQLDESCKSPHVYIEYRHLGPALRTIGDNLKAVVEGTFQ